jgi:hypothetical protein
MELDRRQLLTALGMASLSGISGIASPDRSDTGIQECHRLTRSLLERAQRTNQCRRAPDRDMAERTIRQFADASGWTKPLVIKWMDTLTDAHVHISRFGLDALLDMGTTKFWRRAQPPVSRDVDVFDRAFEVRMIANELLGVDEHDELLMAPKLLAKSKVVSANASEVFRVRAISAQIGWLETSMADTAAQAVANVELLLSSGAPEGSMAIDHQLKTFEAYECGLLATWETPDALICVPSIQI